MTTKENEMEDFVTFKIAKKLEEKGFKEKCYAYYSPVNNELRYNIYQFRGGSLYDCLYSYNSLPKEVVTSDFIDAPTISQVLKWLRDEKKIHFEFVAAAYGYNVIISQTPDAGGTDYYYTHMNYDGPNDGGAWDRFEEAALYCIEYVLDNLI